MRRNYKPIGRVASDMITITSPTAFLSVGRNDRLALLSRAEFVARWRSIVGEPPAIMLDCRREMIRLLVESASLASPDPAIATPARNA